MTDICYTFRKNKTAAFFPSSAWLAIYLSFFFLRVKRTVDCETDMGHLLTGTLDRCSSSFDFFFLHSTGRWRTGYCVGP